MQSKHFHLDKVKIYLDGVFAKEKSLNSYSKCAQDIYRVFDYIEWVSLRNVESWLKGLKIGLETDCEKITELAKNFSVDMSSLTHGKDRKPEDVYYWALATAVWVYGGMSNINPLYKGIKNN